MAKIEIWFKRATCCKIWEHIPKILEILGFWRSKFQNKKNFIIKKTPEKFQYKTELAEGLMKVPFLDYIEEQTD